LDADLEKKLLRLKNKLYTKKEKIIIIIRGKTILLAVRRQAVQSVVSTSKIGKQIVKLWHQYNINYVGYSDRI